MLTVKEGQFGEFENYLQKRSLESKENSMIVGKLKSVAGTLFSILIGISIITVFLAGLVLVQYAQLLISRNEYEIRTDRKSTRLNSSHVRTSYAVFCLK